jgi:hypothetical protein
MSDNMTILGTDDDDDKTVPQSDEDRHELEQNIQPLTDEDTTLINTDQ